MTIQRNIYFMSLVGAIAGMLAWAVGVWIPVFFRVPHEAYWQAQALDSVLISVFICTLCFVFSERYNGRCIMSWYLLVGRLLAGVVGGIIAGALACACFLLLHYYWFQGPFRWYLLVVAWILLGAFIGGILGLIVHHLFWRRLGLCVLGGAIGSLLGASVLLIWGETWPYLAHAVGLMMTGLGIAFGFTASVLLLKPVCLRFESSRSPEVKQLFGGRQVDWVFLPNEIYYIGRRSTKPSEPKFKGTHYISIPDQEMEPIHVRIVSVAGKLELFLDESHHDANGKAFNPVLVMRRGEQKVISVEEREVLHGDDKIEIGRTSFRVLDRNQSRLHVPVRRLLSLFVLVFSLLNALPAACQSPPGSEKTRFVEADRVRLYEEFPNSEQPAFQITVNLVAADGSPLPIPVVDPKLAQSQISVFCDGLPLTILHIGQSWRDRNAKNNASLRRDAIVLVDVSGSMREHGRDGRTKFDSVREACKQFVTDFVDGIDQIAIVPFGSVGVANGVASTAFCTKKTNLEHVITTMPSPDGKANTALFTAVSCALDRLQKIAKDAKDKNIPIPQRLLIVLTDGKNDVGHPGDDPGLLTDWKQVKQKANKVGIQIITMGCGDKANIDEFVLRNLAWKSGDNYFHAQQTADVVRAFRTARSFHLERMTVTFRPNEKLRAQLIKERRFMLQWKLNPHETISGTFSWSPEGLSAPPFEGVLAKEDHDMIPVVKPSSYPWLWTYVTIFVASTVIFAFLWRLGTKILFKSEDDVATLRARAESAFFKD